MSWYSSIVLPFFFGLIGFAEPCSMGINMMFLSSIKETGSANRFKEIAIFMLVRASVLAVLGTSVSFLGGRLFSFQSGFFLILAIFYICIGLLMIFSQSLLGRLRNIRIAHWLGLDFREGAVKRLGLIAGFTIPACAIPLITVFLGQSILIGDIVSGFLALFVFGLALTVPLAVFSFFERGIVWLEWIAQRSGKLRVVGGVVLVLIGIATLYSSVYWEQALPQ
jgi:cytochrome c-type biogenesis protein